MELAASAQCNAEGFCAGLITTPACCAGLGTVFSPVTGRAEGYLPAGLSLIQRVWRLNSWSKGHAIQAMGCVAFHGGAPPLALPECSLLPMVAIVRFPCSAAELARWTAGC